MYLPAAKLCSLLGSFAFCISNTATSSFSARLLRSRRFQMQACTYHLASLMIVRNSLVVTASENGEPLAMCSSVHMWYTLTPDHRNLIVTPEGLLRIEFFKKLFLIRIVFRSYPAFSELERSDDRSGAVSSAIGSKPHIYVPNQQNHVCARFPYKSPGKAP